MPTPVFCCGFECGLVAAAGSNVGQHWTQGGATAATISTTTKRSGLRAIRFAIAGGVSSLITRTFSAGDYVVRMYVNFATLPTVETTLFQFRNVTANVASLIYDGSSGVTLENAGTPIPLSTGTWIPFDIVLNETTDTVDAKVNGVACQQYAKGSSTADNVRIGLNAGGATTADMFVDDLVVSQTAADYPYPPGYIDPFVPTADGTHNIAGTGDFQRTLTGTDILNATTTAFQLVDDVPLEAVVTDYINMLAPINATDYVECVFGPAAGISAPRNAPQAVEVICGINQAGTGAGNMEIRLNDNGTMNTVYTATGVAGVAVATGQQFKRKHYATGPAGAWVIGGGGNGDFTDLRIRFGSPAALDVNPDQYFGCAMIEADFPYKSMPPPLQVPRFIPRRRVR